MRTVTIEQVPGFNAWRDASRDLIAEQIPPDQILWQTQQTNQNSLFADAPIRGTVQLEPVTFHVSKAFFELAQAISCHANEDKFDLMYRLLWRLNFENKKLLQLKTDDDVLKAQAYAKAVRRDAYKITAFLRFRSVTLNDEEQFIAWYEPFHYTLERVVPFFKTRFKNMSWSILMPYRAAHWDGQSLVLADNPDPAQFPKDDAIEAYWLTYYANIFNPARPKKNAMLSQMPKKYWKNMPETNLIGPMLRESEKRAREMINKT